MKICHCIGCKENSQQEDHYPDVFYCRKCWGPVEPREPIPADDKAKYGVMIRMPGWMLSDFRSWTQEKQDAADATSAARMFEAGRQTALKREKAFMDAFLAL